MGHEALNKLPNTLIIKPFYLESVYLKGQNTNQRHLKMQSDLSIDNATTIKVRASSVLRRQ